MKKFKLLIPILVLVMVAGAFAGCGGSSDDSSSATSSTASSTSSADTSAAADTGSEAAEPVTITVGASPAPHAEILDQIVDDLAAQGITLVIQEFEDYVLPNTAVDSGEIDANYFQHQPYLTEFNEKNGTNVVGLGAIHYEPFGLYPAKTKTLEELADGAQIAIPNDSVNEARALLLLQDNGLLTLPEGADLTVTKTDIVENPKKLDIVEIEAAQIPNALPDVDLAVINGNYAIEAGLNVATDALASEAVDSLAATTFANLLAVKAGDESRPELLALLAALQSDKVKAFIEERYEGAVVPSF
jgi:D-methionine transport system substrate-binding protein